MSLEENLVDPFKHDNEFTCQALSIAQIGWAML